MSGKTGNPIFNVNRLNLSMEGYDRVEGLTVFVIPIHIDFLVVSSILCQRVERK